MKKQERIREAIEELARLEGQEPDFIEYELSQRMLPMPLGRVGMLG